MHVKFAVLKRQKYGQQFAMSMLIGMIMIINDEVEVICEKIEKWLKTLDK